jgi:hypothetical protein
VSSGASEARGLEAAEVQALVAVQATLADKPGVLAGARALSHFGEHSIGWLAVSALGAVVQPAKRRDWLAVGAGAFLAHAAAVVIKRIVRRQRPHDPAVVVNELPVRARHIDHRRIDLAGPCDWVAAAVAIGTANGVVPLGSWCALSE